jgi:hypothetical protein
MAKHSTNFGSEPDCGIMAHISPGNGVVHHSHFQAIFGSFSHVWQKNDQNGPKNQVKNDVKNGYCEHSEMQTS